MNLLAALLQILTICMIIYFEYKNCSISIFLWATLLIMFGFPHFISILFDLYNYPSSVMIQASIFVILFNLIYLLTRFIILGFRNDLNFKKIKPINALYIDGNIETSPYKNKILMRVLFICLLISVVIVIYASLIMFGGVLNTSWGGFFTESSSVYDIKLDIGFGMLMAKYLIFASGGVILSFSINKNYKYALLASILIIIYSLITRNRITILPLFIAQILFYISKNPKIKVRQIFFYSIFGIIIIYTVYALRVFRHYGTLENFFTEFNFTYFNERILEMILTGNGELGLRDAFYYFLYNNNEFPDFGKGHTYIRLLLIALPTGYSFGLKPFDFAITMGSAYMNDFSNTITSMHPTLYGDCYANLYWYGILLGVFWGIFVLLIDKIADRKNIIIKDALMVLYGCMYVIIARGSVYNGCYIAFISSLFLFIINLLIPEKSRGNILKAEDL